MGALLVWARPQGSHAGAAQFPRPPQAWVPSLCPAQTTGSSAASPEASAPSGPSHITATASTKGALCHLHHPQKSAMLLTIYLTKTDPRGSGTSPGSAQAPKLTSLSALTNTEPQAPTPSPGLLPEPQSSHPPVSKSGGVSSSGWTVLSLCPSFLTHQHPCSVKASTTPTDDRHVLRLQSTITNEHTAARNI